MLPRMGTDEVQRSLLGRLERAAGLTALVAATVASGPCGSCPESYDDCKSIDEFRTEREQGLAQLPDGGAEAGAAGAAEVEAGPPSSSPTHRAVAEAWDGVSCP